MKMQWHCLVALIVGFIFALGLGISGMTQPQKIIGFLDLYNWDPTLVFVMIGAIATHSTFFYFLKSKKKPFLDNMWHLNRNQPNKNIDAKLIAGSVLFGIGWALGGYCPGPAVTAIPSLDPDVIVSILAMIAGMICCGLVFKRKQA